VFNLITSKALFFVVAGRLWWLRLKNWLLSRIRNSGSIANINENAYSDLEGWLVNGFDKLNIGGGRKNLSGFVNVDFVAYPDVQREVIANILDLGFVPSCRFSHVHSNHVIEHITEEGLLLQIKEYWRILMDDGLLTIRCPNALGVAYGFWFEPVLEDDRDEFVELGFPSDEDFSNPEDVWAHKDIFAFLHWIYGDVGNLENQHLNRITPTKLQHTLEAVGFEIMKMTKPEALNLVVVARKCTK